MKKVISRFWREFLKHKSDLEKLESPDDPAYDRILQSLQKIDSGLFLEFCTTPGTNEFIVTADGKEELFSLVDRIVGEAPRIQGWEVFALKPKLGFPTTTTWEGSTAIAKSSQPRNRQGTLLLTAAWWADGAGELTQNRQTVAI